MKLLFISRAFPPVVGGLENHNYYLYHALNEKVETHTLLNLKGKKALFWFLPKAILYGCLNAKKYDIVLLGDGLLGIVGWFIKSCHPKVPVACVIHGLDITYPAVLYQTLWVKIFLSKMDLFISVSHSTYQQLINRAISEKKIVIIPNGVHPVKESLQSSFNVDSSIHNLIRDKIVLLTVGRLVKRKGVSWFIENVMPKLSEQYIYLVVGGGVELEKIQLQIQRLNLNNRVICMGFVEEKTKQLAFQQADLFIQPNIKVAGDVEGFGIAVLEANSYGLPVLGSKLEGLIDSITENKNGWLVQSENAAQFIQKINEVCQSKSSLAQYGEQAKSYCLTHYQWNAIAEKYQMALNKLVSG